MLEKFPKLTPRFVKTISNFWHFWWNYVQYYNKTGSLNFPKFAKDLISSFLLVQKMTSRHTPETWKPLFARQESQKIQFFSFFSSKVLWWRNEFQLAKLLFSSRNQLSKQRGTLWPNESKLSLLRTSLRFYSALAILEPQVYLVVEQFGAKNISLLSGRFVNFPAR